MNRAILILPLLHALARLSPGADIAAPADYDFAAEDPFIWCDGRRYWAIVKDNAGHFTGAGKSTALWQSDDGLDWQLAKHPLVATTEIAWEDGAKQRQHSLERPQLFFENGLPTVLLFATDDDKNRQHSFNVRLPLEPPAR